MRKFFLTLAAMCCLTAFAGAEVLLISPAPTAPNTHTVRTGDSLWTIARTVYGSGSKWTLLYDANRELIQDPSRIYPGQVLTLGAA